MSYLLVVAGALSSYIPVAIVVAAIPALTWARCPASPIVEISHKCGITCARRQSGAVRCWGLSNEYGEQKAVRLRGAKGVAAGCGHVCILLRRGTVLCAGDTGDNREGELGLGKATNEVELVPRLANEIGDETRANETFLRAPRINASVDDGLATLELSLSPRSD